MKRLFLIICALALFATANGQSNSVKVGTKDYPATSSWIFSTTHYFNGDLEVQIIKTSTGSLLRLAINVPAKNYFIGGNINLYLKDGSIISCTDTAGKEYQNGQSIVLYKFDESGISKLKTSDIQKVSFAIKTSRGKGKKIKIDEDFQANNQKKLVLSKSKEKEAAYNTSDEVTALFQ